MLHEELGAVPRIQGEEDLGPLRDLQGAEKSDDREPDVGDDRPG